MTKFRFCGFNDYEDGKMAHVETIGEYEIPVNIFIDNANELGDLEECLCSIDVCAVGQNFRIFASEEEFNAADSKMAVISMIPIGVFSPNPDYSDFQPSPHIYYTGKVLNVAWDPNAAEDMPNCCLTIEMLSMTLKHYVRRDTPVEVGSIAQGVAWLYGDLVPHEESSCIS